MTIDEELSIIKDNIKEYGQTNITQEEYNMIYNNAIDDFMEEISLRISESLIWGMVVDAHKNNSFNDSSDKIVGYVIDTVKEIAEQLKVGGKNDD